ncbi:MAG: hypothetical protein JWR26_4260 [Pedosphaera sp.]|nr:hypothetical protein [Pedosphaera sp.]
MRKAFVIVSLILLLVGLGILVSDAYTSHRYGFHLNEVAAITDDGLPIDWPTGERPAFTMIPLFVYGLGFLLAAAGVFSLQFGNYGCYHGRICCGTE